MKKYSLLLILVALLFGCNKNEEHENMTYINANELSERISNRDNFVVLVTTQNCDPCAEFINEISMTVDEHNIQMFVLDYSDVEVNMRDQLQLVLGDFYSWPVLIYVDNGEVYEENKYEYSLDPEGWESWLIKKKLIPEK